MIKIRDKNITVIWFNHWFGTAYFTFELAKKMGMYIVSTSKHPNLPYVNLANYWEKDNLNAFGDEYAEWALEFCKKHSVDIFFPKLNAPSISKHKSEFEEIGVKVVVDSYNLMNSFNSKIETYEMAKNLGMGEFVPEYFRVKSEQEYKEARDYFLNKTGQFVMKYDHDEGGISYRSVEASASCTDSMNRQSFSKKLAVESADEIIHKLQYEHDKLGKEFKDFIIMEKFGACEASIDCYNSKNEFIAVPRFKLGGRFEELKYDKELVRICKMYQDKCGFEAPWNMQFMQRERADMPEDTGMKILEINPRLSGGAHLASLSGISTVEALMCDLTNQVYEHKEFEPCRFTQLLYPIKLN